MPTFRASKPVLELAPSLRSRDHSVIPLEREVDRHTLWELAPDREAILLSERSIEEIRQSLKLRSGSVQGSWLYRSRSHTDVIVRDQGASARMSSFVRDSSMTLAYTGANVNSILSLLNDENRPPQNHDERALRRVLSASSISSVATSVLNASVLENTLLESSRNTRVSFGLDTPTKLVSPRALGPTHLLMIYTTTKTVQTLRRSKRTPSGCTSRVVILPRTLEIPINSLLFALSTPNLSNPHAFPHRRPVVPGELPRVLMQVRHIETFHALVVFMHNGNQAELFRHLMPEWIRDLLHGLVGVAQDVTSSSVNSLHTPSIRSSRTSRTSRTLSSVLTPARTRTIESVAKDILEAEKDLVRSIQPTADVIADTAAQLDMLEDNLEHVGYYGKAVWTELRLCKEVLMRAVNMRARLGEEATARAAVQGFVKVIF